MWGSAFFFIEIALTALSPAWVVAGRLGIAAGALLVLVVAMGRRLPAHIRHWRFFGLMAIIGNVLPFYLISWGQQFIDSSLAGILMAVNPLVTVILARVFVPGERLGLGSLIGLGLALIGVMILLGPAALLGLARSGPALAGQLAVLAGSLCYAANTVIAYRQPVGDPLVTAASVLTAASLMMAPLALGHHPWPSTLPGEVLIALTMLGIFATALAAVVYFRLVQTVRPLFLSLTNYLLPVWAVGLGVLFLGERLSLWDLFALALILTGIAISHAFGRISPAQRALLTSTPRP